MYNHTTTIVMQIFKKLWIPSLKITTFGIVVKRPRINVILPRRVLNKLSKGSVNKDVKLFKSFVFVTL